MSIISALLTIKTAGLVQFNLSATSASMQSSYFR
jgi:hypothetical protein